MVRKTSEGSCGMVDDEVTVWLEGLPCGDETVARRIWHQYVERRLAFARKRLSAGNRRIADEDDLAVSAFFSLCHRLERGEFPDLRDREGLWRLLTTIIARKAAEEVRRQCS